MAALSNASASAFCGLWMSISGSMIGTRPAARIWRAMSNCWSTTDFTPASLASLMTERIFVPNSPLSVARVRSASRSGIGFMSWTPSTSPARPLSTFKNGTTRFTVQRYSAESRPSIWRSIVFSKRMAPRMRSPLKLGLVMIRERISCMTANISSSPE